MISLLRLTTPVTLKYTPRQPNQHASPLGRRPTFSRILAYTSNSPASHADHDPPVVNCLFEEPRPIAIDTQRVFLPRPPSLRDTRTDTGNGPATSSAVGHCTTQLSCSSFPVLGPFDLLCRIQDGGFATAWAARDGGTGRLLCLKIFHPVQDPGVTRSVQTELRVFRRMVKSKGGARGKQFIMELNRSIQHDATVFFAMELMVTDLGAYSSTEPERCKRHARRWIAQIALGIDSLHDMGILHRDIKCENILIDSRENVRIIDFGLSYLNPTGRPLRQGGEYADDFLGTPPCMAPEVLWNKGMPNRLRKWYGTAVDWWALGCILFELESGNRQLLFDTEEDVHAYVDWTQAQGEPEQSYPGFDGLDPIVVNLVEGASLLEVQPSLRYSLKDLNKHIYFFRRDGTSEFDNAVARALERRVRPELVPQFEGYRPLEIVEAASSSSIYDWTNLKVAHLVHD